MSFARCAPLLATFHLVALALLAAILAPQRLAAADPAILWEAKDGFNHPESAYFDKDSGHLFVSQVGGEPDKKDGDGFISQLDTSGKVVKLKWVTGLNAPKGLRSHKGTLWVSDIDALVAIDIAAAKIKERIEVKGAKFLNDVACGPDGTVYVSDMLASRIHAWKDGKLSVFAEGEEVEGPNGLLVDGDALIVAAWGYSDNFTPKTPGRLIKFDLKTKKKSLNTKDPTGNLDGLESDGAGGYLVTDWVAGKVMRISAAGEVKLLLQLKQGTADIGYLGEKKLLILPLMLENAVRAYDLSK